MANLAKKRGSATRADKATCIQVADSNFEHDGDRYRLC